MESNRWIYILLSGMVGGLGLFLFGMSYLNYGLKKIAGKKFREIIITLTGSPIKGIGTGFFVTLFNQASSATTVLEVSLVNAGLLTFYQSMAVTMGAEVGSTITAQLVAFKIMDYAVLIAGTGFYISLFSKNRKYRYLGETIIGLGIIFLGMKIMSELFSPMQNYEPFMNIIKNLEDPSLGIFIGMILTVIVRSSGVTSGVVIALAMAGVINLVQAVPVVLGAQVGTCFTALIASAGRKRDAKRAALWHIFHQIIGVAMIYPFLTLVKYKGEPSWIYFVKWFTSSVFHSTSLARQIAMSHTLAAVLNTIIFFPLLPLANKVFCAVFPSKEEEKPFGPIYIDDEFIATPSIALEQAKKEIIREGEIVLDMMEKSLEVFKSGDLKLCETITLKEIHADMLRNAIVPYISKIGQGYLEEEQSRLEMQLLFIADDIESIGDIIDKNALPLMHKKIENDLWFSNEGWKDIVELHVKVTDNFRRALNALKDGNFELARLLAESKPELESHISELRRRHIDRLHSGVKESLETSSVHLDLIDQLKRVNSHTAAICFTVLGRT